MFEARADQVMSLLERYRYTFTDIPGSTSVIEHEINLVDDTPMRSEAYPIPFDLRQA